MTAAGTDALVQELDSAGDLPAGFGPLLRAVPREWFIPDRIWVDRKPVDRVAQPGTWLHAVYSNTVVVTQFDDGRTHWPETGLIPTCSASMPSAVVGMLNQLDVEPGQSVLEIGTGTGFNAALLAELVGPSGRVTTVEIDPALAAAAHDRLSRAGFNRVHTMTGDATRGVPESAPSIGSSPPHPSISAECPIHGSSRRNRVVSSSPPCGPTSPPGHWSVS